MSLLGEIDSGSINKVTHTNKSLRMKSITSFQKVDIRIGDKKTQPNNYFLGRNEEGNPESPAMDGDPLFNFDNETNASNKTEGESNKDHERKRLTEGDEVATDQSGQNGTDADEEEDHPKTEIGKNPKVKKVDIGFTIGNSVYNHSLPPPTTMFIIYNH